MNPDKSGMAAGNETGSEELVDRIGRITRTLHDNLRELGLDREVEKMANAIPDTRDRLDYVVTMSERAAERALNAVDRVQPVQDELERRTEHLTMRWKNWPEIEFVDEQTQLLVSQTQAYLGAVTHSVSVTRDELLEIVMAQDFQDLTGRVIKKMMLVMYGIEQQLLEVLLDNSSEGLERDTNNTAKQTQALEDTSLTSGPAIIPNKLDTLSTQNQVDDLLDELGF